MEPITRQEQLLNSIATGNSVELEPITREEQYLLAIAGLTDFIPEKPITRKEMFYKKILESGGVGGGTSEGVNLSYTLNKDGTYIPIDESKDSVFLSGYWYAKLIYVSDKTYTIEELIGHTIRVKEIYVPTGVIDGVRDIEITRDMITDFGKGTFAIIGSENETEVSLLTVITEDMVGVEVVGGFVLPSNPGTYLIYIDEHPDKQGYVFGSVSVKKAPGKPYIDTSLITDFSSFGANNRLNSAVDAIDTSNATTVKAMFKGSDALRRVPVLNTSSCRDFTDMFSGCSVLHAPPLFDTSNGTTFFGMFANCNLGLTTIPQFDTSNGTNFSNMFYSCSSLKTIPSLNTSKGINFTYMFWGCVSLETISQLDTSNGENFSYMFKECYNITSITLNLSRAKYVTQLFYKCQKLKTVSLTTSPVGFEIDAFYNCTALENLTIGEGWAVSIYLQYSNNLTVESLHGMIENLADLTGQTAKTFQIGATNLAKIDEEHIAMLQAKNWNYS